MVMPKVILKTNVRSPDVFSKKSFSVFHTVSGSGTIKGSVKQDNGSALSGVSVSFAIYGSTVDTTTTLVFQTLREISGVSLPSIIRAEVLLQAII